MRNRTRIALLMALITGVVFGIVFAARWDLIPHSTAAVKDMIEGKLSPEDKKDPGRVVETIKPAPGLLDLQSSFSEISERLNPCVVNISTTKKVKMQHPFFDDFFGNDDMFEKFFNRRPRGGGKDREMEQQSLGSGFIIRSDGYILTNNHVVEQADEVYVLLTGMDDEEKIKAEIVGTDPDTDLAVLKIDTDKELSAVPLGDSDKAKVGDWAIAIGNPFGFQNTVTVGIVSAKSRDIQMGPYTDFIQTDAAINPGNSGGPLINIRGEVIGVNSAIFSRSGGYMGVGFAIPINLAREIMDSLIESGHYSRGYLGITFQEIDEKLARAYGLDEPEGALVTNVMDDTPASKAGLEVGDVIIEVEGKKIDTGKTLQREVASQGAGNKISVVVLRDGKKKTFSLTLMERPTEMTASGANKLPEKDSMELGIQVQNLDDELKGQLGSKADEGVVVMGVDPGSPAYDAGIQKGDVIIKANRKKVASTADLSKIIKSLSPGDDLLVVVERQGYNRFLVIETSKD